MTVNAYQSTESDETNSALALLNVSLVDTDTSCAGDTSGFAMQCLSRRELCTHSFQTASDPPPTRTYFAPAVGLYILFFGSYSLDLALFRVDLQTDSNDAAVKKD